MIIITFQEEFKCDWLFPNRKTYHPYSALMRPNVKSHLLFSKHLCTHKKNGSKQYQIRVLQFVTIAEPCIETKTETTDL